MKSVIQPVGDDLFKNLASQQKKSNWECDSCMTQNDAKKDKCICCETLKPGCIVRKSSSFPVPTGSSISFGKLQTKTDQDDLFKCLAAKQKSANWECDSCMTRNDASQNNCLCCEAQKPSTTNSGTGAKTSSFSFGMQASKNDTNQPGLSFCVSSENITKSASLDAGFKSFLDKQNANWECTACFTRNDQLKLKCACCEQQKPGSATEITSQFSFGSKSSGIILPVAADVKFTFGMPTVKALINEEKEHVVQLPKKDSFGVVSNNIVHTLDAAVEKAFNSSSTTANPTFSFKAPKSNEVSTSFLFKSPVINVLKEHDSKVVPEKAVEKTLPAFKFGEHLAESDNVGHENKITCQSTEFKSLSNSAIVEQPLGMKSGSGAFSFGSNASSTTTSLNENGGFNFDCLKATSNTPTKSCLTMTTPQAVPSITPDFSFGFNCSPLRTKTTASPIVFGSSSLKAEASKSNILATSASTTMPATSTFKFGVANDSSEHSKTFCSYEISESQEITKSAFGSPRTNVFVQGSNNKSFSFSNSTKSDLPTSSASTTGAFTFGAQTKTPEPAAGNLMLFGSGNSQSALQSVTPVFGANTASATFGSFGTTSATINNINNNNESGFGSKMPSFGSSFANTNNNAPQANNQKPAFQFGISEDPTSKKMMPSFGFSSQSVDQPVQNQQLQQQNTVIRKISFSLSSHIFYLNHFCSQGSIPIWCPKRRK